MKQTIKRKQVPALYRLHLSATERASMEAHLNHGDSLSFIANQLQRHASTIAKEIKRFRVLRLSSRACHPCALSPQCRRRHVCGDHHCTRPCALCRLHLCMDFCQTGLFALCHKLQKPPYVCNACADRKSCRRAKFFYVHVVAQSRAQDKAKEHKTGRRMSLATVQAVDALLSPLILQGIAVSVAYQGHRASLPISIRTLYDWIHKGLLTVKPLDLRRTVNRRPRQSRQANEPSRPALHRIGRSYQDFQAYTQAHPTLPVTEMDTVKGSMDANSKTLLTFAPHASRLLLPALLTKNTQKEVLRVLDALEKAMGKDAFAQTFPILLTDNGPEFKHVEQLERSVFGGTKRTRIFFCDPYSSWQKPHVEESHRYIRYVLPKGTSFRSLSQERVAILASHINSYPRESCQWKAPLSIVKNLPPKSALTFFNLQWIPLAQVILTPALLNQ